MLLNGAFFMTQTITRAAMIPQRHKTIMNIASINGMGSWPMRAAYNAAKAGMIVLTEVLTTEWAQYNLRLNCVSPKMTRTKMMNQMISQGLARVEKFAQRAPLKRVNEINDITSAVLF